MKFDRKLYNINAAALITNSPIMHYHQPILIYTKLAESWNAINAFVPFYWNGLALASNKVCDIV